LVDYDDDYKQKELNNGTDDIAAGDEQDVFGAAVAF
jgi:hypothetical protein